MNQAPPPASDRVTVMVFKDHLAARAFHVPTRWFTALSILFGFLVLFSFAMTATALRYYRLSLQSEPFESARPNLQNLAATPHENAQQKPSDSPTDTAQNPTDHFETQSPAEKLANESSLDAQTQPHEIKSALFTGLTATDLQSAPPAPATVPISIKNPRYSWQKNLLQVRFALQYTKTDRGSQQGKIIVLARGPSTLLSYPAGTLNPTGVSPLMNYTKGEFFSVSRYREGTANFGPLSSTDGIKEFEILILTKAGDLLLHQSFPLKTDPTEEKMTERSAKSSAGDSTQEEP